MQVLGPVAVGLYSFTIAWILGKIIDKTMGCRISEEDEVTGGDLGEHAETAYDFGTVHTVHAGSAAPVRGETAAETAARAGEPEAAGSAH